MVGKSSLQEIATLAIIREISDSNLETSGLSGRVHSNVVVIRLECKYILFFKKRNINQTFI